MNAIKYEKCTLNHDCAAVNGLCPYSGLEKAVCTFKAPLEKEENLLQENEVEEYVNRIKVHFNDFKREVDQKWAVYDIFRSVSGSCGYAIDRLIGSNQVILTRDNVTLYDSDGEHLSSEDFEAQLVKAVKEYVRRRILNEQP